MVKRSRILVRQILESIFQAKKNIQNPEKKNKLKILERYPAEAKERVIPLNIEDVTELYVEHRFCTYQTFISCLEDIRKVVGVKSVVIADDEIVVDLPGFEEIDIKLENYRISIYLFGVCRNTPVSAAKEIINIFKDHINQVIEKSSPFIDKD